MLRSVWNATRTGVRGAFAQPLVLTAAFVVYVMMLGSAWLFVRTREATILDLLLTVLSPLVMVALFFALQSLAVRRSSDATKRSALGILRDGWSLFLVSIPVIVLAAIVWVLMDQFSEPYGAGFAKRTLIPSIGKIVLYLLLPLIAIRLWITTQRSGLKTAYRTLGSSVSSALKPSRLLTYIAFAAAFGGIAYLLIFKKTPVEREWVEVALLVLRLVVASVVIFFGWFLGVRAVSELTNE